MTAPARGIGAFRTRIDGIRCLDDPKTVTQRSRDYYWYSPILTELLDGLTGDLVVIPQNQDDVLRVAAAVARSRVPLTLRGGGTGNYGQCVPLEGGVIMDMTRVNRVIDIQPGRVRVEAGARIARLDKAANATGQQLLMWPSTRQIATIGGFLAGGSGGIGSLRHGMLRDPGNISRVRVVTVEDTPQIIDLHGDDIQKVQHAYGTNGIVVELDLALTAFTDWIHGAALFDGYDRALHFARNAQEAGLDCYLLTTVERRFSAYYRRFGDLFPPNRDAVFTMVAPDALAAFRGRVEAEGGRMSFAMTQDAVRKAGLLPAYECGWNHTTLQALKADKGWTYLQVAYPRPFETDLVMRQMRRCGDTVYWHHEMARMQGQVQIFALPIVRWQGRDAMYALIDELEERDGCTVFDPHAVTIEDGGMKEIDKDQIEFKKRADPYGLMNPGKTRGWTEDLARDDGLN